MKTIISLITLVSFSYANQYTFLLDKYDKEIELEAKIIAKIATASISKQIKLFIPQISPMEKKVYSKFFTLAKNCQTSNFVFMNKTIDNEELCVKTNKLFFTNNYKKLLADNRYYGAFFWYKSRPNIVFVKNRLKTKGIELPQEYNQYIEDLDEK
ncbi:hypothetical protein [Sulfurospirillum arcachonense]|uniref:hypothetical protein n=1 Tax=Sulfurospirillum arcachonense TaxID=57666 RepID=UPI00046965C9|nr:hypothetical protein [Sulfurospirillum arcachonense]